MFFAERISVITLFQYDTKTKIYRVTGKKTYEGGSEGGMVKDCTFSEFCLAPFPYSSIKQNIMA